MTGGQIDMLGAPDVGGERSALDTYDTPDWCTLALVDYLGHRLSGMVWEPCAGAGKIVDMVKTAEGVWEVLATDIEPRRADVGPADFLQCASLPESVQWIVTNPPYNTETGTATECIKHALSLEPRGVAMLLRIGWLEPCKDRVELLTTNPPTDIIILPRVHYIGAPAQNNQTSVWVIWERYPVSAHRRASAPYWYGPEIREQGYWARKGLIDG